MTRLNAMLARWSFGQDVAGCSSNTGAARTARPLAFTYRKRSGGNTMSGHRIFATAFSRVYPLYVQKAERKGRTREDVDTILCWLTGYSKAELRKQIEQGSDFATFFARAPAINPNVALIKGVVCGVRVEDVEDPLMRNIRYLDKLIDELAKGRAMEKILRR
jgi:hypothetical protein